jgi:hypothetical protein
MDEVADRVGVCADSGQGWGSVDLRVQAGTTTAGRRFPAAVFATQGLSTAGTGSPSGSFREVDCAAELD